MTLFTAEGLGFGFFRASAKGVGATAADYIHASNLCWYRTQGGVADSLWAPVSRLLQRPEMHVCRAPGNTCLAAQRRFLMLNAKDHRCGTDSETLELAIRSRAANGIMSIPPRVSDVEPERTCRLIDRAILLPENTTVVLQNCTISNVICNSSTAITVAGFLNDSVISNVVNRNPQTEAVRIVRENGTVNVTISNIIKAEIGTIHSEVSDHETGKCTF